DLAGFERLMEEQREKARRSQKKQVIELSQVDSTEATNFVGYDTLECSTVVTNVAALKNRTAVLLKNSPFYAEMGGQVGDSGELIRGAQIWTVTNTQKAGQTWLHLMEAESALEQGEEVLVRVNVPRRKAIERHHTVTHLLHWALHEVVGPDLSQK